MSALKQVISNKTDKELMFYINNVDKHTDEAVHLALTELQNRSVPLPEGIADDIENQLNVKKANDIKQNSNSWKNAIVTDLEAPAYYSKNAIYVFSILFSVFFGSFMLASNCKNAKKPSWPVILFGFSYTALTIFILEYLSARSPATFIANGVGVLLMYELFWSRYIGTATKYRAKPIWKPLIIAAIIFIPLIILIIYAAASSQN